MKSLLIMDWLAKLCLLLPIFLTGRSLGTMVGCLVIGLLAWLWFSVLLARAAKDHEDFFDTVSRLGGRGSAWLVYLIGLLYFLSHTAVCMSFCADLAQTYMLPEVPLPALVILPLIAGLYLAYSGIEVRGRVSELLVPILLFFFLFMAAAAVPGMNLPENGQTLLKADRRLWAGGYEVFAAVGGMFLPVLAAYLPDKERDFGRSIRRAACWSVIPAGILLFITAGSFGTEGMLVFRFPGIRVMSNVAVPGGFVQRWDILFLSLLLFSLAVSVASGFWYLNTIAERLWSEAASYLLAYREYREQTGLEIWAGTRITRKKTERGFGLEPGNSRGIGTEPAMPGQPAIVSAAIENANGLALYKWQQELAEEIGVGDAGKNEVWEEKDQDTDETGEKERLSADRVRMSGTAKDRTENLQSQAQKNSGTENPASFRSLFILQGTLAFIVFCAAGGFRSAESAIIYYRAYNLYILTPVMFVVYLMLYFRGKQDVIKHRTVKTATLCLLLCFLLTGCTARELEDRMFPMALEIRVDDGIPTMIYAWNGESDSGSGGGGRSRELESESGSEQKSGDESESETEQGLGSGLEQKSGNESENETGKELKSELEQKYGDESGNGTRQEEGKAEQETEFEKGAESGTKQEAGKRTGSESGSEAGTESEERAGSESGDRTGTKSEKRTESKSSNRTETESGEQTGKESDYKTEAESAADTKVEEGNEAWKESLAEEEESGSRSGYRSEYESGDSTQSCFGSGNTDSTENAEEAASIDYEPQEEGNLTIFRADNLAKIQKQVEEYGDRYIDYSHVKAIIWDEKLEQYPTLEQEIYEWLAAEPAFAANLIIYPAQESGLTLEEVDERSDGEIGVYLENLYRNNQRLRESAVTLGKMTSRYYDLHEDKAGKPD